MLNLSAFDPGDAIDGWFIVWGDETPATQLSDLLVAGTPSTAQHVYTNGDASYTIVAVVVSGNEFIGDVLFSPVTVHNVAPTVDDTTFSVPEHLANGTVVGTPLGTNAANDALTFTVLSGNKADAFARN